MIIVMLVLYTTAYQQGGLADKATRRRIRRLPRVLGGVGAGRFPESVGESPHGLPR